jgi:biotin transport system substrate-specific component
MISVTSPGRRLSKPEAQRANCGIRSPMTAALFRPATGSRSALLEALVVVGGVVAMAAASRVAFDVGPVPITLQTYVLFVLAGLFGGRLGLAIVLAWLACAAFGLPVLSGGSGGWRAVIGHTAGFLAGMAVAAWVCGRGAIRVKGWAPLAALFLAGHVMVLMVGWAGLASFMSPGPAFESGILPLLPGAALKSLAAALTVRALTR